MGEETDYKDLVMEAMCKATKCNRDVMRMSESARGEYYVGRRIEWRSEDPERVAKKFATEFGKLVLKDIVYRWISESGFSESSFLGRAGISAGPGGLPPAAQKGGGSFNVKIKPNPKNLSISISYTYKW